MTSPGLPDDQPVSETTALSAEFRRAWTTMPDPSSASPELLPVRLSRACVQVLPVDGAGLSMMNGSFRLPLGTSDEQAGCAERLQFTQGEGPCLAAAAQGRTLVLGSHEIARRWPQYADELFRRSSYRAVMSVPLVFDEHTRGALDLFLEDETRLHSVSLVAAATVAERIAEALAPARSITSTPSPPFGVSGEPAWLLSPTTLRRETVWVAMGMVMTRLDVDAADALSLIRGNAYSDGTDLDDVAERLIQGDLDINVLAP